MIARYAEVLAALNDADVRYVVVGGLAVILHGHARLTIDLDLMIDLDPENAAAAVDAFAHLGLVPSAPVELRSFADPRARAGWIRDKGMVVFQLRDPGDPLVRVDAFVEHPLAIEELLSRAVAVTFNGVQTRIASIEHLIEMKRLAGRAQDLADIEALEDLRD